MSTRVVDVEQERAKRAMRRRIARLRRRIDGRVRSTQREARRLVSWKTYVRSYPGYAVTAALGMGLALSAGLSRRRLSRWLGQRLVRRAIGGATGRFWRELAEVWADSEPRSDATKKSGTAETGTEETGAEDGEA
jgi:ElaB/YqjD/DUF883 family membrane-anchored ribosome-binding protein